MQPNVTEILEGLSLALDDLRKDFDARLTNGNDLARVQLQSFETQLTEAERRYTETLERFSEQVELRGQTAELELEKIEQGLARKLGEVQSRIDALTKEHQSILEGRLGAVETDLGEAESGLEKCEADLWQLGKTLDTLQGHISSTIETVEKKQEEFSGSIEEFKAKLTEQEEDQQQSVEAFQKWIAEIKESLAQKEDLENFEEWTTEKIEAFTTRLSGIQDGLQSHIVEVDKQAKYQLTVAKDEVNLHLEKYGKSLSGYQVQLTAVRQEVMGELGDLTEQIQQIHTVLETEASRSDGEKGRLDRLISRLVAIEEEATKEKETDRLGKLQVVLDDSLAKFAGVLSEVKIQTQEVWSRLDPLEEAVAGAEQAHTALAEQVEAIPEGFEAKLAEAVSGALAAVRDSRTQTQEALLEELEPLKESLGRLLTRFALTEEQIEKQEKESRDRDLDQSTRVTESAQKLLQQVDQRIHLSERKTDELRARINLEQELHSSKIADKLRTLVDETASRMRLELGPQGKINEARQWMPGREFAPLEIASYRSGLWQARRLTSQEPNCQPDSDWGLLAPGLHDIKIEEVPGPAPTLVVGVVDSAGRAAKGMVELPVPRSKGTWDADSTYEYYDWVVRDGSSWLLIEKESKGEDPTKSDNWALMSMRGRQGKQGKRGLPGPPMPISKVFEAIQSFFDRGDGVPIFRFRGMWEYGMSAEVGDVVNFDYSLFLCITRIESAESPPTYTAANQSPWALMIEVPRGGGAGGGSSTDELVGITANDQAPGYLFDQLESGDNSVIFTIINPGGDEKLDLQATGVGGGQANIGQNVGGGIEFYRDKTGVSLNYRTVGNTARVVASLNGDLVEFTVPDGVFDLIGSAAAVQAALDGHEGTNAQLAHPDGVNLTDLNNHKIGTSQHSIAGVTGLQAELNGRVLKSGDVMSGYLTLFANPSLNLHAAPKQYVDLHLLKSGGTMTGPLVLAGVPTMDLHAATKKYVDDNLGGPTTDELVKVSATDTTAKFLLAALFSSDNSVTFTLTDGGGNETIDVKATGAGGGEANRGENIGGGPAWYAGMSGVNLQLRTPVNSTSISATLVGDNIRFDAEFGFGAGQVAEGAATQTALDGKEPVISPKNSAFNRPFGAVANTVCEGDDARLSDARTPVAHANTHATGQPDALAPADIGAEPTISPKNSAFNRPFGGSGVADTVARSDHDHAGVYLTRVEDDLAPRLGGELQIGGPGQYVLSFTDATHAEVGAAGHVDNGTYYGSFLAYGTQGQFDPNDGALLCAPGRVQIFGSGLNLNGLHHTDPLGYQQLYVTDDGYVFSGPVPDPGWSVADVSNANVALAGLGTWHQITGLEAQPAADVAAGDRLDLNVILKVIENSGSRNGEIGIGFGVNGSPPTVVSAVAPIGPGFDAFVPVAFSTVTHGGLVATDTVTIWAQRVSQSHAQFDPVADGTVDPHEMLMSVPSGGTGGPGGDPTNLGTQYGPTSVVITSSTGANATIVEAVPGGDAGVISGADKQKLDSVTAGAEPNVPTSLAAVPASTTVDITSSTGSDATIPAAVNAGDAGVMTGSDKAKLDGIEPGATQDQTDAEIETAYNNQVAQVTEPEKTAGTETDVRRFSPKDVADMAGTHGGAPGGGDIDGSQAIDWSEAGQAIAATGNQTLDLDVGHHFYSAAAMTADKTINFVSGRNHTYTYWSALIDVGTSTPTFQFDGSPVRPAKDYNISDGGLYWFTFAKSGSDYVVSERQIP